GDLDTTPANHVYDFMIATRFGSEYAAVCKAVWYPLVQAGVHPAVALSVCTIPRNGPKTYWDSNHGPLPSRPCPVRLAKGAMIQGTEPFSTGASVTPATASWGLPGVFREPPIPMIEKTDSLGRSIKV